MARSVKCAALMQALLVAQVGAVRAPDTESLPATNALTFKEIFADEGKELCGTPDLRAMFTAASRADVSMVSWAKALKIATDFIQQNQNLQETAQATALQECSNLLNVLQSCNQEIQKSQDAIKAKHKIWREAKGKLTAAGEAMGGLEQAVATATELYNTEAQKLTKQDSPNTEVLEKAPMMQAIIQKAQEHVLAVQSQLTEAVKKEQELVTAVQDAGKDYRSAVASVTQAAKACSLGQTSELLQIQEDS